MYEDYVHYITKGLFDKSSKKVVDYYIRKKLSNTLRRY